MQLYTYKNLRRLEVYQRSRNNMFYEKYTQEGHDVRNQISKGEAEIFETSCWRAIITA